MQMYRNCWQTSSQEMMAKPQQHQPQNKSIRAKIHNPKNWDEVPRPNQKAKQILPLTPLVQLGMVDFGTVVPTSLVTAHVKRH